MSHTKLKRTIEGFTILSILMGMLIFPPAFAGYAETDNNEIERLITNLTENYVDLAYWTSDDWKFALRHNQGFTSPTDEDISQADAVRHAVRVIVDLGYETVASMAQCDRLSFTFRFDDFGNREWWLTFHIPHSGRVYTVALDAKTGAITNLIAPVIVPETSQDVLPISTDQENAIDILIQKWKMALEGTTRWELDERLPMHPSEEVITREEALKNALITILKIRGAEPDALEPYSIGFGSSDINEWVITLMPEGPSPGLERIYVLVNADTGLVTNVEYRRAPLTPK